MIVFAVVALVHSAQLLLMSYSRVTIKFSAVSLAVVLSSMIVLSFYDEFLTTNRQSYPLSRWSSITSWITFAITPDNTVTALGTDFRVERSQALC